MFSSISLHPHATAPLPTTATQPPTTRPPPTAIPPLPCAAFHSQCVALPSGDIAAHRPFARSSLILFLARRTMEWLPGMLIIHGQLLVCRMIETCGIVVIY
ncbi:hypothetical protein ACP275_08G200300 [Erythranthe tilingii]